MISFELRGAHAELFRCRSREVLLEGPVGTGKTRSACEYARWFAEIFPMSRILFCRKTRVSMSQSVLVTLENQVLGWRHPAIVGSATRANRTAYIFPNGSEVVIGGLDDSNRILSTEYDLIIIFEAAEVSPDDLERLATRLRNWVAPYQQLVCDTNPRGEMHWLNLRAEEGIMTRLLSRHWMNPALYDMDLGTWTEQGAVYLAGTARSLANPARFAQLFEGRWATDIGLIYPMFDRSLHVRDYEVRVDEYGVVWLHFQECDEDGNPLPPREMKWTVAAADWGFTVPGTLQVWGVDSDQTLWLLCEIYHRERDQDWWADRVVEFRREFNIRRVICDPAEPDRIKVFNDRLGNPGGREDSRIAIGGNNKVDAGIAHVQSLMVPGRPLTAENRTPGPKIYYRKNSVRFKDKSLVAERKPWCLIQEKAQYYWDANEEGKPIKERPDPTRADHAMDAERMMAMWVWRRDLTPAKPIREIAPGSYADILNHRKKLDALRRKRMME